MTSDFAHRTTKKIVGFIIAALIFVPLAIFIFTEILFHLWNWLMPALFHLSALTSLWQALGLMVLSWILFGGLRGVRGAGRRYHGRDWRSARSSWEQMSPEERNAFREWFRARCAGGSSASPSASAGAPRPSPNPL